jgi:uncharacterized membrane protein
VTVATITFYSVVLFVHIAATVIAFGGLFAAPVLLGAARGRGDLAWFHGAQLALWTRVVSPAATVVLLAGLYLAFDGPYEFGDPWIGTTLLILIIVLGVFGGYLTPRLRRLAAGEDDGRAAAQVQRAVLAVDALVLVAIFLMATKPGA